MVSVCYGLNHDPPNSYVEAHPPPMTTLEIGALRSCLNEVIWVTDRTGALIRKERYTRARFSLGEHSEKTEICEPGRVLSRTRPYGHSDF